MAKNYCTFIPSKGKSLFKELKKEFGYQTARSIFLRAINPQFINDFKGTLSLDTEGIPTYESLMKNSYMKDFIGSKRIADGLNKKYTPRENTIENYSSLLESAQQFNTTSPYNDDLIATVEQIDANTINVVIQPKTKDSIDKFQDQYATQKLNERLSSIFGSIGVNVGTLTDIETNAGRVGVTDFSVARDLANGFSSLIRVANNMEGATALSEEFSHLIVGVFRNEPLIQRAINSLQGHEDALKEILGDSYEDTVLFHDGQMNMVAEEALGHILQKNLLNGVNVVEKVKTPSPSLFKRLFDWILSKFKGYSIDDVQDAINFADAVTSDIARKILDGTKKVTESDVRNAEREAQFNALSDKIDRNIEILREAAKAETKRYKIAKANNSKVASEALVNEILSFTTDNADTIEGLLNYSKHALDELRSIQTQFQTLDSMSPEGKFKFLRLARMYNQSYGSFIKSLNKAIIEDESDEDNMFLREFEIDGKTVNMSDVIKELNSLSENLEIRWSNVAMPAFIEFLKPFLGNEIVVPYGKDKGMVMTADSLIREAQKDISFMDRWLDSMADSADVTLQAYDAAVKKAKDTGRLNTLDLIREIQKFREDAEREGITDFEWAYEVDDEGNKSSNYISEVNHAQFAKDLKEFEESIEKKYGKNPTEEDAVLKMVERNDWMKTHATSQFGTPVPNPVMYRNEAYFNLTDVQKRMLERGINLKSRMDSKYPKNRVSRYKAIQMRKSGSERFWESVTSPSTLFENIKENIKSSILEVEDDDQIFGDTKVTKGLTDFAGNEFMVLPVLYTNTLSNPNEISTDFIGSLMAYAYSTSQYEQMEKIIDPLEVGYTLLTEERKVRKTRGSKALVERINELDLDITNKIFTSRSNIEQKLSDYRESQIYGRYLKDEGTFFDSKVSVNKFTSLLLKGSSLAQLGFNWLANIANVATGLGMQNIEAVAGQFFNPKELMKADTIYAKELVPMMSEIGKRSKTNKLDLFYELFNVKQNFNTKVRNLQKKSWLQRLFGAEVAFIGQDAGDHWLYGRTAVAMALREKVLLDGKEMSLWDALQVENTKGSSTIKQLNYRDITNLDGTPFDVSKFSRKVAHINQSCFGIYNDDDANAANRVAIGRLLQQYRKWMKAQYNRRFQAGQENLAIGTWEEGYYRTAARVLNQLVRGQVQLNEFWDNLHPEEQANLRRALTEMAQFFAVLALANFVDWPDDKDRPWALKLAEYSSKRLAHELGGLAPSTIMPQELLKTVTNPVPATSVVRNLFNLVNSTVDPTDWDNEISSGPYKGMSTLEKNFLKAPIPGVAQYRQIDKFIGDLDTSIDYYARPSSY